MEKDDLMITNKRIADGSETPGGPDNPEPPDGPDGPNGPNGPGGSGDQGSTSGQEAPKTADTAMPGLWIGLAFASGILLILDWNRRRRINKLFSRKR